MRSIWLAVILSFTSLSAGSQTVYIDYGEKEDTSLIFKLYSQARIVADSMIRQGLPVPRLDIIEQGFEKYLMVDGRFDLFHWTGSRWLNLYRNNYHGYNFMSRKFACDFTGVYSYGGYGFWMHHGHIIHFDFGLGKDWNLMKCSQRLPLGAMYSDSCKITIFSDSIYKIDVLTQRILSTSPNSLKGFFQSEELGGCFESVDYLVVPAKRVVVKKKSDEIVQVPLKSTALLEKMIAKSSAMLYIRKNMLYFLRPDNRFVDSLDMEELFKSGKQVTARKNVLFSLRPVIIILGISIPLFIAGFWFSRIRRNTSLRANTPAEPTDQISFKRLLPYSGKTLSVEQLDDILELTHSYPEESKRFKRFHLVKDINQSYKSLTNRTLITRQRDPHDGRRYVYFIQK